MARLPGEIEDFDDIAFRGDILLQGEDERNRFAGPDVAANDNGPDALDGSAVPQRLEQFKQSALQAADEAERVKRLGEAHAFFDRLPAAQINEAQVRDWRRSWAQDYAESHIRMLPPEQAIDLLQPKAVERQPSQASILDGQAQPAQQTNGAGSYHDLIPKERQEVLLQDARHRHALERVTAAIERGNALERQISEAASRGVPALPAESAITDAPDLSAFERKNLLVLHRKAAQDLATLQRAMERFADPGSAPFDPFDANDRAEVDALYRKLGANDEALTAVFRRTGLVPQLATASFRDELASGDPARVQTAADTLSGMLERNPDALTGIAGGSELKDAASAYRHLVDELGLNKEVASAALLEMHVAG